MVLELKVRFSSPDRFVVQYDDRETEPLVFVSPLVQGDRDDVRWYLETYGRPILRSRTIAVRRELRRSCPYGGRRCLGRFWAIAMQPECSMSFRIAMHRGSY